MKSACFISAAALIAATPALAQAPLAESVTVVATRSPESLQRIGSSVTILTRAEIQQSQAIGLVDLLSGVPSVSYSRNGGFGGVAALRLRGAEADQTVILIDGVKLNDPASPGGGFNFANLMVGDLARVEVLRGPQSTLYGSQAMGGVINLVTASSDRPLAASVDVEAGELQSWRGRAGVYGRQGAFGYQASAGHFTTGGFSAFDGGAERDGFENTAVQGRVTFEVSESLDLEAHGWWSKSDADVDGFPPPNYSLADTPETAKTEEAILYAGAGLKLLDGRWRTRLGLSRTRIDRESLDPGLNPRQTFIARGQNDRLELQSAFDVSSVLQLVGGGELETAKMRTAAPSPFDPDPAPLRASSDISALYAQAQVTPAEWLTATFGVRRSDHEQFGEAVNLRATVAARFNDGATIVRAAAADAFKAPTPYQLMSEYGNLDLRPEEAVSVEAGVEQSLLDGRLIAQATWFRRRADDQIDFASCFNSAAPLCASRPFGFYDNIAKARAEGVEASLEARLVENLTLTAAYSHLDARNRTAGSANFGKRLARRAEHTGSVTAAYRFASGLELSGAYTRVGDSFDNASNSVRLDGYGLVTLRFSQPLGQTWTLYGRVENAGDDAYQTTAGYASAPRQAFIGLRAAF